MSEDIDRHVLRKYEVMQKLGKGAYGIVWKAIDKKTKETVALKKCFDAFQVSLLPEWTKVFVCRGMHRFTTTSLPLSYLTACVRLSFQRHTFFATPGTLTPLSHQNSTDAQRTFREIMFLQGLRHDNIIRLLNVLKADNDKDIYLIFEYMETDLHAVC